MKKRIKKYFLHPDSNMLEMTIRAKRKFNLRVTNQTQYIDIEFEHLIKRYILTPERIKISDLAFINEVRKRLENSGIEPANGVPSYFRFYRLKEGVYKDVIEMDLSAAYWSAAHQLGYIDDTLYEKGLLYSKKVRLMALGAAASVKRSFYFDGEKFNKTGEKKNQQGRDAFRTIASYIDRLMTSICEANPSIFGYWVDAFFLPASEIDFVRDNIQAAGLNFKFVELSKMEFSKDSGRWKVVCYEKTGRIKPFLFYDEKERYNKNLQKFLELIKFAFE